MVCTCSTFLCFEGPLFAMHDLVEVIAACGSLLRAHHKQEYTLAFLLLYLSAQEDLRAGNTRADSAGCQSWLVCLGTIGPSRSVQCIERASHLQQVLLQLYSPGSGFACSGSTPSSVPPHSERNDGGCDLILCFFLSCCWSSQQAFLVREQMLALGGSKPHSVLEYAHYKCLG